MITNIRELALDIAQELILHPERWTKGEAARSAQGTSVPPKALCAESWCVIGMIAKREPAMGWWTRREENFSPSPIPIFRELGNLHGSLLDFNDHPSTTPELMIKFLRKVADNPLAASITLRTICVDNPPPAA